LQVIFLLYWKEDFCIFTYPQRLILNFHFFFRSILFLYCHLYCDKADFDFKKTPKQQKTPLSFIFALGLSYFYIVIFIVIKQTLVLKSPQNNKNPTSSCFYQA